MMSWWIQLSAYLLCSFLVFRRVLYLFYVGFHRSMETLDWVGASLVGFLAAIFGPFSLTILLIHKGILKLKKSNRFRIPLWVFVAVPFEKKVKESEYRYE